MQGFFTLKNPKPKQHSFNLFQLSKTASKFLLALNSYLPSMAPPIANKLSFALSRKLRSFTLKDLTFFLSPTTHLSHHKCLEILSFCSSKLWSRLLRRGTSSHGRLTMPTFSGPFLTEFLLTC